MTKKLVIAGGGHAALPVIKMGTRWKKENITITLVSAEPYLIYSGALPQFAGGFYSRNEVAIDLKDLCKRYSVDFRQDYVTKVDDAANTIRTASGNSCPFDVLLLNVGAKTDAYTADENVYPVKPMSKLLPMVEDLKSGRIRKLLIAGGGAAGTELALNLSHPASKASVNITLVEYKNRLIYTFPKRASQTAFNILSNRGVQILLNTSVQDFNHSDFDAVIMAAGNEPESLSIEHPYKKGKNNRILTLPTLQLPESQDIFAAGDTADVDGQNYKQIGVHAVKQGPLLRHNIKAFLDNRPLKKYNPYLINPLILSNGPGHAIFTAKSVTTDGKIEAILKYVVDMHWLEKYTKPASDRRTYPQLFKDGLKRAENAES